MLVCYHIVVSKFCLFPCGRNAVLLIAMFIFCFCRKYKYEAPITSVVKIDILYVCRNYRYEALAYVSHKQSLFSFEARRLKMSETNAEKDVYS